MAWAYGGVELPVTNLGAIFNMCWTLINTPSVGDLTPPVAVVSTAALAIRFLAP